MKLNDNEKRDIVKYLEAGKPLPEKYRFLLFDEDREVELVWNGKTNEVTNLVLPFQVIEQIDEPRSDAKFGNAQGSLFDFSGRQILRVSAQVGGRHYNFERPLRLVLFHHDGPARASRHRRARI